MNKSTATVAGGCFWCLDTIFQELRGVLDVKSGYAGGNTVDPTYEEICAGNTGHAEVLQISFDENIISFDDILRIFFVIHDPTTLNRQGNDIGTQYRSAIFYHDEKQKKIAEAVIDEITREKIWDNEIVTEVSPIDKFYVAEDYHQDYYNQNKSAPYCQMVIQPKVIKFRKKFSDRLKKN